MKWRKGGDEYYIQSDLGYRICKGYRGPLLPPIYTAWAPRTNPREIAEDLLYTTSIEEAKLVCEEHYRRTQSGPSQALGLLDR